MASNKNFVVKNGLQVAENLIFTSADLGNVGVGTTLPTTTLEVLGQGIKSQDALFTGIVTAQGQSNLTNLSVSGVSTLGTFQVSSGIATASSGIITYYGDGSSLTGIATSVLGGTNINVSGVTGNVTVNLDDIIDITGANISGVGTIATANVTNLTASGISTLGTVQISSDLNVSGISTFASDLDINASVDISGNLTVDGLTDLDELNVAGISTFGSDLDINASVDISNNLTVDGLSDLDELNVAGIATFASDLDINASVDISGNLTVDGLTDLDELNVAGIATFASDLDINASVDISNNLNVSGVITATSFSGNITGTAATATNVTVADESSDTSCFILYSTEATGDISPKTGSNLTFNSSTGTLSATSFSGDGSGLTGLPVGSIGIQSAGTTIGTAVTTLNFIGAGNTFKITGTIVDISIDSGGGGGGGVASTITVTDESTDTTCFPIFSTDATGDINPKTGSNLTFNSSTGALTATSFVGSFTGNADTATTATNATNINIADESSDTTCFPVFATDATGNQAPKTGSNLTFNSSNGTLSATTFSGSGASLTSIPNGALDNSTISGISLGSNLGTLTMAVSGTGLSGSDTYDGSANTTFTVTSNATNSNTASTIVARDASGNFSAGTITANLTGTATTATAATRVTLTDQSADTTCFPVFCQSATGDQLPHTGSNLTFNSSTGALTATSFVGDLTGDVTGNADTATSATSATTATTATNANNINLADESSDTTCFPVFATAATGNQAPKTDSSALTYDASTGTLAATNVNSTSDANLKENIETIVGSIDILKDINGVKFVWKELGTPSVGVIAQDVEKVLPELVSERGDTGAKSVNYNGLVGVLIEAVKELSARVSKLENR